MFLTSTADLGLTTIGFRLLDDKILHPCPGYGVVRTKLRDGSPAALELSSSQWGLVGTSATCPGSPAS